MQNYVETFPAIDRLHDVLVWALVAGRLTDEEVELVEATVSGEWRQRWLDARVDELLEPLRAAKGKPEAVADKARSDRDAGSIPAPSTIQPSKRAEVTPW